MQEGAGAPEKRMRLRYAAACRLCGASLAPGTQAIYEGSTKTVRCLDCIADGQARQLRDLPVAQPQVETFASEEPVQAGVAGASARREYERRKSRREDRIRSEHPKLGGLILALSEDPQSTRAWDRGARGEERLGLRLDSLAADGVAMLHDRRIPGTRANIDHLAVTTNGVWVIDAKRYAARPTLKVEGGILRPRVERLLVGRRDCSKLVDAVVKQVEVVARAIGDDSVMVHGALAFVDADWPLVGGAFTTRGVHVLWPKRLAKLLTEPGTDDGSEELWHRLAIKFPPA